MLKEIIFASLFILSQQKIEIDDNRIIADLTRQIYACSIQNNHSIQQIELLNKELEEIKKKYNY